MYLFDKDDLIALVANENIFSRFQLLERERQVVQMHLLKGFTFQFIGGVFGFTKQTAHRKYDKALHKMRTQIIEMLEEKACNSN